jgi:hypothetical protein
MTIAQTSTIFVTTMSQRRLQHEIEPSWQRGEAAAPMAAHPRENPHVLRVELNRGRIHQRRSPGRYVSPGISHWWTRPLRYLHCTMGGQEVISDMPIAHAKLGVIWVMKLRERAREQAARNALTLFFLAAGFIITWGVIIGATLWAVSTR